MPPTSENSRRVMLAVLVSSCYPCVHGAMSLLASMINRFQPRIIGSLEIKRYVPPRSVGSHHHVFGCLPKKLSYSVANFTSVATCLEGFGSTRPNLKCELRSALMCMLTGMSFRVDLVWLHLAKIISYLTGGREMWY